MTIKTARVGANFREARVRAAKVFARAQTGKRLPDYKRDPVGSAKVSRLGSEVTLRKAELQALRQDGAELGAAESGVMTVERGAICLHGLLTRVLTDPDLTPQRLEQINAEKDNVIETITQTVQNVAFGGRRLLDGGVADLGLEELGLDDFEFVRPITEEEAIAQAEALLNDPGKVRQAQRTIHEGIQSVKDMSYNLRTVINAATGQHNKARAAKNLILCYLSTEEGGERGNVHNLVPEKATVVTVTAGDDIGISDEEIRKFANRMYRKIRDNGMAPAGSTDTDYGYGAGMGRKHVYNFGIRAAFENLPEEYKPFAKVVSDAVYEAALATGATANADHDAHEVVVRTLGDTVNAEGLYEGGAFGTQDGKFKVEVSNEVRDKAREDAQKTMEQRDKVYGVLDRVKQTKLGLAVRQSEVDSEIESAQEELERKEVEISTLADIDPAEAQAEMSNAMAELFVSMYNFCILLQNKLHFSMQLSDIMIGSLETAYDLKKDG